MAEGAVRAWWACTRWQRGLDCNFNVWLFHLVLCLIWGLTAAVFFGLTFAPLRARRPTGAARRCLLLGGTSALLSCLDSLFFMSLGNPMVQVDSGYGAQLLASIGTIFLVAAVWVFARTWCDVASVLGKLGSSGPSDRWSPRRWLSVIRCTYTAIMVVQVPIALLFSVSDYKWAPKYDIIIMVYVTWLAIALVAMLTAMAVLMLLFARRQLGDGKAEKSFRRVTFLNFLEQVLFDICWILSGSLYLSSAYNEYGNVQATVYALNFMLQWLMHIQLIFFFTMCDLDDPLYSQESYTNLLSSGCASDSGPKGDAIGMATLSPEEGGQPPPVSAGVDFTMAATK